MVDVRGATSSTVNILLESLYLFKVTFIIGTVIIGDILLESLCTQGSLYDRYTTVYLCH